MVTNSPGCARVERKVGDRFRSIPGASKPGHGLGQQPDVVGDLGDRLGGVGEPRGHAVAQIDDHLQIDPVGGGIIEDLAEEINDPSLEWLAIHGRW